MSNYENHFYKRRIIPGAILYYPFFNYFKLLPIYISISYVRTLNAEYEKPNAKATYI